MFTNVATPALELPDETGEPSATAADAGAGIHDGTVIGSRGVIEFHGAAARAARLTADVGERGMIRRRCCF